MYDSYGNPFFSQRSSLRNNELCFLPIDQIGCIKPNLMKAIIINGKADVKAHYMIYCVYDSVRMKQGLENNEMINREDMLELTRRMTPARHCFDRIAGAYMDADGFIDGSFNIHFGKLDASETARNLKLAKTVPFSGTNKNLKEYSVPGKSETSRNMLQLLRGLKECSLKNDDVLYVFYEQIGERFKLPSSMKNGYGIFLFHGTYDIPLKASDKERLWESEEIYRFLICVISPLKGEYEMGDPVWGFLYPAFSDRSSWEDRIDIFNADPDEDNPVRELFTL